MGGFATDADRNDRATVAEVFGNTEAFKLAEWDAEEHEIPVSELLALRIFTGAFSFIDRPRFAEMPESIALQLFDLQNDVRSAVRAGAAVTLTISVNN